MFERCIYFNLNALVRRLNLRWEQTFSQFGLAPSHAYLLRLVLTKPGQSQQALADEMRLEKSTLARFLTLLQQKGLIERRSSEKDPRLNEIYPSETAMALQADLEAAGDEQHRTMRDIIGADELQAFVATAQRIAGKL